MMQELVKATYRLLLPQSFLNRDFSMFHYCTERQLNLIVKLKVAMLIAQCISPSYIVLLQIFVSCISA